MNSQAGNEQTTQPVMDDLTKAFAQVCFLYGCIINDNKVSKDTEISRYKWLAEEAKKLGDLAIQIHDDGGFK